MNLHFLRIACTALLPACAPMAHDGQPASLGELLDKGAKRLDGAELKTLIAGATSKGTTYGGRLDMETAFAPDGTAAGRFWGGHPEMPPLYKGTWSVNEQGQLCIDFMANERSIGRMQGCGWWYRLNDVYYVAQSDARSAVVRARKIQR